MSQRIKKWQERMREVYGLDTRGWKPDEYMIAEIAELRAALAAVEPDAARYRGLRELMTFVTDSDKVPKMSLRQWLPAPEHDPHQDWMGERFDASVDRAVDAELAARKEPKP